MKAAAKKKGELPTQNAVMNDFDQKTTVPDALAKKVLKRIEGTPVSWDSAIKSMAANIT